MTLVIIGFLLIALTDFKPLVRQGFGREMVTFLVIFFTGFTMAVLLALHVEIPSVMNGLGWLIKIIGLSY